MDIIHPKWAEINNINCSLNKTNMIRFLSALVQSGENPFHIIMLTSPDCLSIALATEAW